MARQIPFARVALFAALSGLSIPAALGAGELANLGTLNGGHSSSATGVNADGSVVVGVATDERALSGETVPTRAFRWTVSSGMVSLGALNGGRNAVAYGVNADGSVIVGTAYDGAAPPSPMRGPSRAFRWTQATGMVSLGELQGTAFAVNANGSVVVGSFEGGPFRWTQATGMVSLGSLNRGMSNLAGAYGVSADGSVVVGAAADGAARNAFRAFRWTQASAMVSLGALNGGNYSSATGVNGDGSVVVGGADDGAAGNAWRAFRWTQASGMVSLGTLPGLDQSGAYGVNADGSVVVGSARDSTAQNLPRAFRWTQATGMVSVEDWLRAAGVAVAPGLSLSQANAVNADGSVVVGAMDTPDGTRAYLARVSPSGNGVMALEEYYQSLSSVAPQRAGGDRASLVLHGAHNNPLLGLVPEGQSCSWVTGDWGRDDYNGQNASLGLAEVGACHRLSWGTQLSAALGGAKARQDLPYEGRLQQTGGYALLEAIVPVFRADLWATLTGYYGWGEARVSRGYLNAGMPDASRASASVPSWAVRARLDWQNALTVVGAGVTPYADVSYIRATVDAYTETGGGFPAHFDARGDSATQLRYGVNAIRPLTDTVRLLGTLEGVHQFNDEGSGPTGQVLGLFSFALAGPQYKQNWLRAGIGVDAKLGGGTASLMVNATTEGQDPSYWVSASYRIAF